MSRVTETAVEDVEGQGTLSVLTLGVLGTVGRTIRCCRAERQPAPDP